MSSPSSPVQALVALYSGHLQGVRFGDVDSESLGNLTSEVDALSSEVEAREAQLASLREALAQKEEALVGLAQQALAYAKIYAESDETLSAELNEIALPRASKPRKSASNKATSERAPRASKAPAHNGEGQSEPKVDVAEGQVAAAEPAPAQSTARPRRNAAGAAAEPKVPAPAPKVGRRKVPTRSGRGAR